MANVIIGFVAELDKRSFRKAESDAKKSGKRVGDSAGNAFASGLKAAGAAAIAAVSVDAILDFSRESIQLAQVQAQAEAQLEAAIRSTGNASGFTADQLKAQASALQELTLFGDETTISAQALLLTFKEIEGDTFPRTIRAAQDLATAMGTDLNNATLQVGKALNDPIQGLTALRRSGIQFTDAQEDLIKSLVETNQVAEAQNIILSELESQFGGSAEAAANAAGGGITQLNNAYGDLQEQFGLLLLDIAESPAVIDASTAAVVRATEGIVGWRVALDNLGPALTLTADRLTEFITGATGTLASRLDEVFGSDLQSAVDELDAFLRKPIGIQVDDTAPAEFQQQANEIVAIAEETDNRISGLRQETAAELVDIQRKANQDIADANARLEEDLTDAAEDSADRISDIQEDAAKERAKLAKDLAKELRDIDRDLAKERDKLQRDTVKRIQRTTRDNAREDKSERRRSQIDALADERLFNFELRNLAADGNAIAIMEAVERRKIEEEIAREKASAEREIEQEKRADELSDIRDDANQRQSELEQDAAERRALAQEANAEAIADQQARLAEELTNEREAFAERQADLVEFNAERLEEIRAGEEAAIQEVAEGLTQVKDITNAELAEIVPLAFKQGENAGEAFQRGILSGLGRQQQITDLTTGLDSNAAFEADQAARIADLRGDTQGSSQVGPIARQGTAESTLIINVNGASFGVDDLNDQIAMGVQAGVDQFASVSQGG